MKKTRSLVLSTAISVSMALLAGCGGADTASTASTVSASAVSSSSSSGEKTKISFMGWGTDSEIKTYQTLIDQFEEKYPDVEVEYIVVADNEFDTKLQTMFGAGEAPDVFYCGVDNMMKYAATGNLYDMTDFVKNNEIFDADNIWPALIDLYKYDGKNQGSGSIYALPKDVSVFPIFYNVDLFKEAGITPPTIDDPWDWNDYLDAAQKLTSGEGDEKIYGSGAYSLESAIWSNGGEWVDPETLTTVEIDDPAFTEALQWAADLRLKYNVAPTVAESESLRNCNKIKSTIIS